MKNKSSFADKAASICEKIVHILTKFFPNLPDINFQFEGMDQERERRRFKNFLIGVLVTMLLALYIGLHLGNAMWRSMEDNEVVWGTAFVLFTKSLLNPFRIFPTKFKGILICLIGGFIGCLYEFVMYTRKINTMDGAEHGTASFNTNFKALLHDYVLSPTLLINKKLDEEGITDKKQRKEMKKEMENAGEYEIDQAFKEKTGRKVCKKKVRNFSEEDVAYCKLQSQIYAENVYLSMDTSMTQLNLNTIVFGGSGAGKSRFFVKPNLLQANSSYVVTDPSGELMMSCGKFLEEEGYTIKCLNIEDMSRSNRYNPFAYVKEDSDIPIMVGALIDNIEGPKKGGGGDNKFWDETSRTLLIAICGYLFETQPMEKRNFNNVLRLLEMADVSDDREVDKDPLDLLFEDLENVNPESYAVSQYKVIKQAGTGKTAQNIIISTTAIFARFFRLDKIVNLTYKDEIHLEEIGQKKCALFIVTPQGDTTYNFLASLLYTQLFATLYKQGEEYARETNSTSVKLKVPVRCLIDEAANIGVIPQFAERLATMRKYGISACPIYQNQAQVKALFKDNWETIVGNCDTMLFLGGIDASTVKTVSDRLGKGTIKTTSDSLQNGRKGSTSESRQTAGRELMTQTEIEQMDNTQCITFIRSMKPFKDHKYPYQKHPNYDFTGDADEENNYRGNFELVYNKKEMERIIVKRIDDKDYAEGFSEEFKEMRKTVKNKQETKDDTPENDNADSNKIQDPVVSENAINEHGGIVGMAPRDKFDYAGYEDNEQFDEILKSNIKSTPLGMQLLEFIKEHS